MFERTQRTVHPQDPTVSVTWRADIGAFRFKMVEFFGDVTGDVSYKRDRKLFTSPMIHPWLNKLVTKLYNHLENDYQFHLEQDLEGWEQDPYGPLSRYI